MFKSDILDTLVFDDEQIVFQHLHALRTFETYQFLNISVSTGDIEKCYQDIENSFAKKVRTDEKLRIIFSIDKPINYTCEIQKIEKMNKPVRVNTVEIAKTPGPECNFKWANRELWNKLLEQKQNDTDDILLVNTAENAAYDVIETSRFNVFCYDEKTNTVYTPPLTSGCLNGVYRRYALTEGSISLPDLGTKKLIERTIKLDELSYYDLFVANSVRGILKSSIV